MIERRRRQIDHAGVKPEKADADHRKGGQGVQIPLLRRASHALGFSGGARGIEHGVAHGLILDPPRRHVGERRFQRPKRAGLAADEEKTEGGGVGQDRIGQRRLGQRRQRGRGHHHAGRAVLDDVGDLGSGELGRDAGVADARTVRRHDQLEKGGAVFHQKADPVPGAQAP